jgi:uncharacterized protein (DUF302 family)
MGLTLKSRELMQVDLYKNIGKLFYAIGKVDGLLTLEEYRKLNEILDCSWRHINPEFIETTKHTFNELYLCNTEAYPCYEEFISFYKTNPNLFTKELKSLILKTANGIAHAFAKINKSELIFLAKLSLEFKKTKDMTYYFTKTVTGRFEAIETEVIRLLKNEGFGILTRIDMQETLKKKLNVDFRNYLILGACNPPFAYKALQAEDKIGTLLPCNIIMQEHAPNTIEVSAVNPVVSMKAVDNKTLKTVAEAVSQQLKNVINSIANEK